jgi:hypothetical protein
VTPAGKRLADGLATVALAGLPWALYGAALGLWWTQDDFFQLRFASDHGPAEYSLDPEVWRRLPNRVLSPLLFASYDLDLALAGLHPPAFYAHQLLALGLAALALYGVLRLWLAPGWCLAGGVVFLLGPPVAALAPALMARHYPEAVLLALLSAGAFVAAERRSGSAGEDGRPQAVAGAEPVANLGAPAAAAWALTGLSAVLYLAACLAKEIAVPLPALLALLPAGRPRSRLRLLVPHGAGLVLYLGYRIWMLGTPLGGYGWVVTAGEWPGLALRLPARLAREVAGPGPWGWAVLAGLAAGVLLHAARGRRAAALLGVGVLAAVLPILPVAAEVAPRYAVPAWLILAAALPGAAHRLAGGAGRGSGRRRAALGVALTLLLAAAFAANRQAWSRHYGLAARMSAENRGFLELGPGEHIRHPAGPTAAMEALPGFARDLLGRRAEGGWFYDDLYLCERPRTVRGVWSYDPSANRLRDVSHELPTLRRRHCGAIRWRAPLEAAFRWRGDVLSWELGPYDDAGGPAGPGEGGYAVLFEDGRARIPVPRRGAFGVGPRGEMTIRLAFASPENWTTYSPPLELREGEDLTWRR